MCLACDFSAISWMILACGKYLSNKKTVYIHKYEIRDVGIPISLLVIHCLVKGGK